MSKKILIIRFSALGDVAMTIPVVYSLAEQYPELEIMFLTRKNFEGMFLHPPSNFRFMGIDLKQYDGISGINRLFKELKQHSFDYVADFHGVLRTHQLRVLFKLSGVKTAMIDKGRGEKKKLTRRQGKQLKQLPSSFQRYQNVLKDLGFDFNLTFKSIFENQPDDFKQTISTLGQKDKKWIGIAPFAKHNEKIYPLELQEKVIEQLSQDDNLQVFIFGGGESEKKIVDGWKKKYPSIVSLIGLLNMKQELVLMSELDVMLSMDSGNMHLASLTGTPVVSVWGATHPYLGFMGYNQSQKDAVQIDLDCRPCSVFGQVPCYRGDHACMYGIKPEKIVEKIINVIIC